MPKPRSPLSWIRNALTRLGDLLCPPEDEFRNDEPCLRCGEPMRDGWDRHQSECSGAKP